MCDSNTPWVDGYVTIERGEVGRVLVRLRLEVVEVDVAVVVAGHHDDAHAGHHRAGGVGAVRRRRDEAHGAGGLSPARVVLTDGEQAGELTLGAGVGLERHRVVAGDLAQRGFEVGEQLRVARGLVEPARTGASRRTRAT